MIVKVNILHFYLVVLIYVLSNNFNICDGEQNFIYLQRPVVVHYDTSYVDNVTITMRRYNRTHPLKFITYKADVVRPLDNSIKLHIYFYELLSNVYKRSFVEYHVALCDGINDIIVGSIFTESYYRIPEPQRPMKNLTCPIMPGHYELKDMKLNLITIPAAVPFVEGRLYINGTHAGRVMYCVYLDFTIKTLRLKNN